MGDLLNSASLLLAAVALLYGLWYENITKALDMPVPAHPEDRTIPLKQAKAVYWGKSIPLTMLAITSALVFLPDTISLTLEGIKNYKTGGLHDFLRNYDAAATAYWLVDAVLIILASNISRRTLSMLNKINKLKATR
jgi:hypothetical protein